jgi:hypothetical protein
MRGEVMTGNDDAAEDSPNWDIPPWELPGNFRRDAEPHRGPLLRKLADAGYVCSAASCCPFLFGVVFGVLDNVGPVRFGGSGVIVLAIAVGLLGVGLSIMTLVLARRDLAGMRSGLVDPTGEGETEFACGRAVRNTVWGFLSVLL